MSLVAARLTLRFQRFELVTLGSLLIGLTVAAIVVAAQLDAIGYSSTCLAAIDPVPPSCQAKGEAFYALQNSLASPIAGLLVAISFGAAAFVGVAIVGRELERGTTRLAWSLAPSRRGWYLARLVPILVVLAALTFLAGVAADRLTAAGSPGLDIGNAFDGFGTRGVLVAARAMFVFALAVAVGSVIGRALQAVIVVIVLAWLGLSFGENIHERIIRGEAIVLDQAEARRGDRYIDQAFRLPDGRLVGWDVINQIDPPPAEGEWIPKYPMVSLVVPREQYRFVETREALVLVAGSLVGLAFAGLVVVRRRPG